MNAGKRFGLLVAAVTSLAAVFASSAGAAVVWTGAVDGDITNDGNYDFTGSSLLTISGIQGATVMDDIVYNNSGTAPTLSEAALQPSWGTDLAFGLTFDGVISGTNGNDGWRAGAVSVINGAQTTSFFYASSAVSVDATSSLVLQGGGNPVATTTVDLAPGATVTFINEDVAAFNAEHLSKFTVNGAALVDGVNGTIVSDGGSGSIVTAIPEPASMALMGLGGLMMLRRRRA